MKSNLKHIAVIMDGNGRWANERHHPRVWGHVRGSSIVSDIVEEADDLGVEALTLYTFSTENWSRPQAEIKILFMLLKKYVLKERKRILKNNIQFRIMGDISGLPEKTIKIVRSLEEETKDLSGLKLTFAFGYGGRSEITHAVNSFIKNNPGEEITESTLREHLYIPGLPDVDLMIRTGGDQRISNYLLWQMAYAELYFTNSKWPEFTKTEFRDIILSVSKRQRRFGMVLETQSLKKAQDKATENKSQALIDPLGL